MRNSTRQKFIIKRNLSDLIRRRIVRSEIFGILLVELDVLAGEPLDVMVNGCLIAQGEVVIVNDRYGIRLTDIVTPTERLRKLNR